MGGGELRGIETNWLWHIKHACVIWRSASPRLLTYLHHQPILTHHQFCWLDTIHSSITLLCGRLYQVHSHVKPARRPMEKLTKNRMPATPWTEQFSQLLAKYQVKWKIKLKRDRISCFTAAENGFKLVGLNFQILGPPGGRHLEKLKILDFRF